ncbi:haloacid dehalogenase [Zobellella denitrificans]|uniref:Haloacid dehalogenase n=1 Tax=Zobellella denitrificans TaxID=347534 RepID=A0A231MYV9_9GAMM|nr:beta-phosphoglucomutase family hydrolase [Zobellella denitrificans]ATG75185.1 haloacid dehalogenase [Zobellella denitrificans]OXS14826.1 haloacid dehalogenase [Zobellella denitrificans]
MHPQHFDGLIFDLDGTLVDTMPLHLASWELAAREFGFGYDAGWLYDLGGVPSRKIVDLINGEQGLRLDGDRVVAVKNGHYQQLLPEARPFPAMLALLEQYADKPMAIGTGSSRVNAERVLLNTGLRDYFPVVITADDVNLHKPNPDTYLLAARELGLNPGHCLVFEDTPIGRQAAEAAGMACVMVVEGRPLLG